MVGAGDGKVREGTMVVVVVAKGEGKTAASATARRTNPRQVYGVFPKKRTAGR